jgi:hypothetical protein
VSGVTRDYCRRNPIDFFSSEPLDTHRNFASVRHINAFAAVHGRRLPRFLAGAKGQLSRSTVQSHLWAAFAVLIHPPSLLAARRLKPAKCRVLADATVRRSFGSTEEDVQRHPRRGIDPDALKRGDVPIGSECIRRQHWAGT